jgi:hypothetical protein
MWNGGETAAAKQIDIDDEAAYRPMNEADLLIS